MLGKLDTTLDFHSRALQLRAERQGVIAGNIANADTPNYKAVDFNFANALQAAIGQSSAQTLKTTSTRHMTQAGGTQNTLPVALQYRVPVQSSLDGNTVDMDVERANFADNTLRYEAALRALNSHLRSLQSAVQGNS